MKRFLAVPLVLFFTSPFYCFAQKSRGDKAFANYDYRDAITYYKKAYSSNSNDTGSLVNLAACYRILRDYSNAETYYAKAANVPGMSASTYYYYGEILKCNGKIDDARKQFVKANMLQPKDSGAAREIRFCDKLKQKYYVAYQVKTISNINSDHTDFCPVLYQDNLVFISDRKEDIVNMSHNNAVGGNFFKVFYCRPSNDGFGSPKAFPVSVNKTEPDYNVGPVTFSQDGKLMYFTQVAARRKNDFVNQAKLFYCEKTGNKWSSPKPFPYNSDAYSVMDPSLSPDGKTLYFSSNMPGGFGGCDIYACQQTASGNWSQPKNLGSEINTPGNEAFPYVRSDGQLFFASDRHFNYGGLDIFSADYKNGKWTNVHNLGPDINSPTDDFGICFNSNNRTGYFSSNREGGNNGKDDVYGFIYTGDYKPINGSILFSYNMNDPVPNVEVHLLDESGKILNSGTTDTKGKFSFDKLEPDKKYFVKVNEDDPRFAGKKKFYLADSTGRIVGVTIFSDKVGKFVFSQLPADLTELPKIDASDKSINLAGNLLQGDSSKPMSGIKVSVVNESGDVIQSVTTNSFGAFVFTQLPPDENYEFKVDMPADAKFNGKTKVTLTDKSGNTLKTFYMGSDGAFKFQVLATDTSALTRMEAEDPELKLELHDVLLSDKKTPLAHVKVSVVDKNGNVLQSTTTDGNGAFSFTSLPEDKSDMIQVDVNDPKLSKMTKLFLADSKKNVVRELDLSNGSFKYEMLIADKKNMGSIYVNDPWITALNLKNNKVNGTMKVIENIYYDYEKWDILPAASHVLDKVVQVMKNDKSIKLQLYAYTDPRGTDEFNLQLSQQRADAAVNYLVAHGVEKSRLTGKGLGKTHLLNDCGDPNVHCSDAEFAINRRTEFKLIRNEK